jgi:trimethylamine:corrinoid methyltransferase-like protein
VDHTLRHYREAYRSALFTRDRFEQWEQKGRPDLAARALARYRAILAGEPPVLLPDDVRRELDQVVREADTTLVR